MQIKMSRQRLAHSNASDTVAMRVQARRKHADSKLTRQNGDHPASYTALGRHAYIVNPFAGIIIHPARSHNAQHALYVFPADRLLARDRVRPPISERRGHYAKV